jgi:hypothetical protein
VIGPYEQARRILERRIGGKPGRVGMAVRADDRKILDMGENPTRDGADGFVGRKKAVRVEAKCGRHEGTLGKRGVT